MIGLGTIVNVAAILIGGGAGLILKKVLSQRITDTVMQGVGLAVIIIGIGGALSAAYTVVDGDISTSHILVMIISLAIGALIGELINIESKLDRFAKFCERRSAQRRSAQRKSARRKSAQRKSAQRKSARKISESPKEESTSTFAQGFVTATLVYCVGAMAIVGSLEDGISQNRDILFAKSVLDGITAMIFASTMGMGVLLSAIVVGVYQGAITLLAVFIAPYFDEVLVTQMSLIGSVLIMSIGINLLKIAKIKVGNLLPALFIPVIFHVAGLFI
ncbi:MAG: DUF554 domain-containing protein [Peptococcaceae bacterium]|nr:DUF554 domain-containing protein [Peptococcaceae bacterium]